VEFSLSSLDKLTDDELEDTGKSVSALATANLAALDALTTKFHGVKSAPRTALAGRAGVTNTLPDCIRNTTSLLRNRLDKLMTRFKKTNPEFYAAIKARVSSWIAAAAVMVSKLRPRRRPRRRSKARQDFAS